MVTEFKISDPRKVEEWCLKNIGPRMYYLHNRMGGQGWTIHKPAGSASVVIEDDNRALMAMIIFGFEK
jgi:hypothetical protein